MVPYKITVIVPVYNVKDYLRDCVDSILAQTFSNLEIILVDDGSTDGSAEICDWYATVDRRVSIYHTKNQGVSAARNFALDRMTGDWVGFVDSDDWIEPDMFEKLLNAAVADKTSLAACSRVLEYRNGQVFNGSSRQKTVLRTIEEFADTYYNGKVLNDVVWEKLYRKDFFDNARFPLNRNYEDTDISTRMIADAHSLSYIPDRLYHYRQRTSSIVHTLTMKNCADRWAAEKTQLDEFWDILPAFREYGINRAVHAAGLVWDALARAGKDARRNFRWVSKEISDFSGYVLRSPEHKALGVKEKALVWITKRNNVFSYILIRTIKGIKALFEKKRVLPGELFD